MKIFICSLIFLGMVFSLFGNGEQNEALSNPGPVLTEEVKNIYNLGLKFSINEEESSVFSSIDGIVYRFSRNEDNPTNFGKFLELECSDTYFYNGEERIIKFYILYSNLLEVYASEEGEKIERGTEIGESGGSLFDNNLLICVYTFQKDPYISYLTKSVSTNLLDAHWYNPGFLFNEEYNTFNYFKYREIDLRNFTETIEETRKDTQTIEVMEDNVRFYITLDTRPEEISEDAAVLLEVADNSLSSKYQADFMEFYKTSTEIVVNNTKVILLWPEEFDIYLNDEIGIGNDVYLYGMVSVFNHYDNSLLILVGDFTNNRLETLIDAQYDF